MGRDVKKETTATRYHLEEEDDHHHHHPRTASSKEDQLSKSKPKPQPQPKPKPRPSPLSPADNKVKKTSKPNEKEVEFSTPMRELSNTQVKNALLGHAGKSMPMSNTQYDFPIDGSPSRGQAKSSAVIRAQEVRSKLEPQFPSFVKSLVRSHVASCFWMGLPTLFCKSHLPDKDITITLEDEIGKHYQMKYLAYKTGLSAGWRQFAVSHKLLEGDVLVFQLVEPAKFKVYITRANDLTEVDGALGLLNFDSHTKQNDTDKDNAETGTVACNDSTNRKRTDAHTKQNDGDKDNAEMGTLACNDSTNRKRSKSSPLIVQKKKKIGLRTPIHHNHVGLRTPVHHNHIGLRTPVHHNLGQSTEPSENDSEEVDSEVLEVSKLLPETPLQFEDIKSFENFSILVNGFLVDSELSEDIRKKYYKLCRSQNAFLHENVMEGMNYKLIVGAISETVNIADAIRACQNTTTQDDFASWDKYLKAFELLGMNVGFLRARLCQLANLAYDSEPSMKARMYKEARNERTRAGIEMRNIERKLEELRDACDDFGAAVEDLRSKADIYTTMFHEEVTAPW